MKEYIIRFTTENPWDGAGVEGESHVQANSFSEAATRAEDRQATMGWTSIDSITAVKATA